MPLPFSKQNIDLQSVLAIEYSDIMIQIPKSKDSALYNITCSDILVILVIGGFYKPHRLYSVMRTWP